MDGEPPDERPEGEGQGRVRWSLVVLCVLVGLGVLALAWVYSDRAEPEAFWSGVLVNVGSAILLAAFIFWLERSFVRATRRAVKQATQQAVTTATAAATEAAKQETSELRARLDSLQDQIEEKREQTSAEDDAVLRNLEESTSWEAMFDALGRATKINAVDGFLSVLSGPSPQSPLISFTRVTAYSNGPQSWPDGIQIEPKPRPDGSYLTMGPMVSWRQGTSPAEAFHALEEEAIVQGYGSLAPLFDAAVLITNLRDGLVDAMAGRRGTPGAWRSTGTALELLGPDWVISELGIENRGRGVVLDTDANLGAFSPVTRPDWADQEWWDLAVTRLRMRRAPRY